MSGEDGLASAVIIDIFAAEIACLTASARKVVVIDGQNAAVGEGHDNVFDCLHVDLFPFSEITGDFFDDPSEKSRDLEQNLVIPAHKVLIRISKRMVVDVSAAHR